MDKDTLIISDELRAKDVNIEHASAKLDSAKWWLANIPESKQRNQVAGLIDEALKILNNREKTI